LRTSYRKESNSSQKTREQISNSGMRSSPSRVALVPSKQKKEGAITIIVKRNRIQGIETQPAWGKPRGRLAGEEFVSRLQEGTPIRGEERSSKKVTSLRRLSRKKKRRGDIEQNLMSRTCRRKKLQGGGKTGILEQRPRNPAKSVKKASGEKSGR